MDKKNTQQKTIKQQPYKKDPFPLIEKENLTDIINLSGPPTTDLKYALNQVFNLQHALDTIPLSKIEVENFFLSPTEKITLQLLQKYKINHTKWFLIKSHENQLCSQQMPMKIHKDIVNQTKIQFVIIYHYIHMI